MGEAIRAAVKAPETKKGIQVSQVHKGNFYQTDRSPVEKILYLQRTIGNQSIQRLMKSGALQAKLTIGAPGDRYEQEADRVAEQVMRMPELRISKGTKVPEDTLCNPIQSKCPDCKLKKVEDERLIRAKGVSNLTPEAISELESSISAVRGGGQPLPESVRAFHEPRFGADFSQVRVHTGSHAAETARSLNARAFTIGHNIAFGPCQYAPESHEEGRRLMAHELTHVVQQTVVSPSQSFSTNIGVGSDPISYLMGGVCATGDAYNLLPLSGMTASLAVQRKDRLTGIDWRNVVIEGINRIQEVIRAAQKAKKGKIEIDLLIEPDFVGIEHYVASGKAPSGDEPDGFSVFKAAENALSMLADEAPAARRVITVILERTSDGWDRPSFVQTGETRTLDETATQSASSASWSIGNYLNLAHTAGRGEVRLQVVMSEEGVKIVSWQATGAAKKSDKSPSTEAAKKSFDNLVSLMHGRVLIYEVINKLDSRGWEQTAIQLLGEVKPIPPPEESRVVGKAGMDEGEMVIEDVKAARRLVLTTAARLIAEQDPTRLDNLIFSLGPFAVMGVLKVGKVGKLGKLGKLAKLFGRPGRRVFGETNFKGLVKNRPLRELTDSEITHAFSNTSFKLSNHANMRLRDARTESIGVNTLDDVAGILNDGIIQATKHAEYADEVIEIVGRNMNAIVNADTNVIISFVPR